MRDLSQYDTLKPIQQIQEMEVAALAATAFTDTVVRVGPSDLLGEGVNHAFNSPLGRLRLVDSLATDGRPEGPASPWPEWLKPEHLAGPTYEWMSLAGPDQMATMAFDRTPEHRFGTEFVAGEQTIRNWLLADPKRRKHLRTGIVAEEISALSVEISDCAARYGQPPRALIFASRRHMLLPSEAGHAFVAAMPVADAIVTIRTWKHQDTSQPWDQHDKMDLMSLGVAIPYCDFVITERRWAHMAKATGLGRRYGTKVGHGLTAMEDLIEAL